MQTKAELTMDPKEQTLSFDTFTCFLSLPAELRVKIWKMAADERQVVKYAIWNERSRLRYSVPGVLHANRESRLEVQKYVPQWSFDVLAAARCFSSPLRFLRKDVDIPYIRNAGPLSHGSDLIVWSVFDILEGFKTLAVSHDIYDTRIKVDLLNGTPTNSLFFPVNFNCKNLLVVIEDREYQWTWHGADDYGGFLWYFENWTRHKIRIDSQEIVQGAGGFRKVMNNIEFSMFLKYQFQEAKEKVLAGGNGIRTQLGNGTIANMEMEVVSE